WQQELTCKVCSMKQGKTPFSEFINSLHHNNLLLKGLQFHLSPAQLHTQIESNISSELAAAFNLWKDNHKSSDDEAAPAENAAPQANTAPPANAAVTAAAAAATATLKSEERLQGFIDTLTKLDHKLVKDRNARKHDAEDAARSLKRSSSTVGLTDNAG
ncbi:hypothetical protein L208DRAFT_1268777, partial [Tricholoma matsutake]